MRLATVIWLLCGVAIVDAYIFYQDRIPNVGVGTSRIPIPINQGITFSDVPVTLTGRFCQSIGHASDCAGPPAGGGNPFGRAFNNPAFSGTFTLSICMADSDGDEFSNGDELGDPGCQFLATGTPSRTTCLSHPGFSCSTPCDPFCEGSITQPQCGPACQVATNSTTTLPASSTPTLPTSSSTLQSTPLIQLPASTPIFFESSSPNIAPTSVPITFDTSIETSLDTSQPASVPSASLLTSLPASVLILPPSSLISVALTSVEMSPGSTLVFSSLSTSLSVPLDTFEQITATSDAVPLSTEPLPTVSASLDPSATSADFSSLFATPSPSPVLSSTSVDFLTEDFSTDIFTSASLDPSATSADLSSLFATPSPPPVLSSTSVDFLTEDFSTDIFTSASLDPSATSADLSSLFATPSPSPVLSSTSVDFLTESFSTAIFTSATAQPPTMSSAVTSPTPTTPPADGPCPEARGVQGIGTLYGIYRACYVRFYTAWERSFDDWVSTGGLGCPPPMPRV